MCGRTLLERRDNLRYCENFLLQVEHGERVEVDLERRDTLGMSESDGGHGGKSGGGDGAEAAEDA